MVFSADDLKHFLQYCANNIPFYHRIWSEKLNEIERNPVESFLSAPIMTKQNLRDYFPALISQSYLRETRPGLVYSSGTTGKRQIVLQDTKLKYHIQQQVFGKIFNPWRDVNRHELNIMWLWDNGNELPPYSIEDNPWLHFYFDSCDNLCSLLKIDEH